MARRKEFDVDQVLDRATELFWTKGYEETSMRELEEGLGVGRPDGQDLRADRNADHDDARRGHRGD